MGHDGIRVGVQIIRKFVIKPAIICVRSVYNHPILVGILLIVLYLYRSFPFLFQLLVSASPVLVCTAVLLGILLSFGENNISTLIEDDERNIPEIAELKTDVLESRTVVAKSLDEDNGYSELKSEMVERSFAEEPLLGIVDTERNYEILGDFDINSREIEFEKESIREDSNEFESVKNGDGVDLGDRRTGIEVHVSLSHEIVEERSFFSEKAHFENFKVCKSAEGSVDVQMRNHLEYLMASEGHMGGFISDVTADNLENHETYDKLNNDPIIDRLESSSGSSWTQFDSMEDGLSSVKKIKVDNFEDYISGEGSVDAQIGSPLELSLGSWNHLDSDRDIDSESDSGSDGAESSSPDASLADIIPMLDELHPLLEDENSNTINLSCHGSIHSDGESEQHEEEDDDDVKSEGDNDNEEEIQDGKEDSVKSAIDWTEEDQKNLMELGTSDLERNQRLESLVARRRARRMISERNPLDLEGMDLSFPIAPISTTRYNPFDNGHDSYGDLGLPPIPGSAPSIMVKRQNPFDLPYDSSEEKPDLTGDSFQEEFMEFSQRESTNPRLFKRNETFSAGSSIFDFGRHTTRASRFGPHFVPERTDSDAMSYSSFERQPSFERQFSELSESRRSYSSLQRESSDLSESKASSAADTDMTYTVGDHDENKISEKKSGQGREFSPDIGHASDYEEHGSQCSHDLGSISDDENDIKYVDRNSPVIESIGVGNSLAATSYTSEAGKGNDLEVDHEESEREVGSRDVHLARELVEINQSSSSLPVPKEHDDPKDEDDDGGSVNNQVHSLENVDSSPKYSLETSMSDIPTHQSNEEHECRHASEADESHPKEPIYDSSPLAIKRNPSSSSLGFDLQRETSEIDLYHVQRDLFAEDESKIHDKDAENNDGGSSANKVTEVTEYRNTASHFTGLNQQSSDSLASSEAQYDFHSSKDSSAKGLVNKELLDNTISLNEAEQVPTKGDDVEGQHVGKLDTSVADVSLEDGYKSSTDLLTPPPRKQIDVLGDHAFSMDSNLSSSEVELKQETEMKYEGSQHFLSSTSSMNSHNNDASKELLFALDEAHFLPFDSLTYDPSKQAQPSVLINLEGSSQVDKAVETENVLKVQEPEDNILPSLLQNDESSSQLDILESISVSELAAENSADDIYETNITPGTEEQSDSIMYGERAYMKEMDEELLSELDAVGDFSMQNISMNSNKSYLDHEANSNLPEEVEAEVNFTSGLPYFDSTSLIDITDQNSESSSLNSDRNLVWSKELISDSHVGHVSAGLLVLEHQSSQDIDAAFKKVCEEEVQNFDADESVQAEGILVNEPSFAWTEGSIPDLHAGNANIGFLIQEDQSVEDIDTVSKKVSEEEVLTSVAAEAIQVEDTNTSDRNLAWKELLSDSDIGEPIVGLSIVEDQSVRDTDRSTMKVIKEEVQEPVATFVESELSTEATEPMSRTTEEISLTETTLNDNEAVPERSESNLTLSEGHILDSSRMEPGSEISVNTEVTELPGEDFEHLETDITCEPLERTAELGIGSEESLPLPVDTEIRDVQNSPVAGTVSAPPDQLGEQTERSGSVDFNVLPRDVDIKKEVDSAVVEACTSNALEPEHPIERVRSLGSESWEKETDVKVAQESPVSDASIAPAVDVVISESSPMNAGTVEIHDSPVEASFEYASESGRQIEPEGFREPESLFKEPVVQLETEQSKINEDFEGVREPLVVEASVASAIESGDHRDANILTETMEVHDRKDPPQASHHKHEVGVSKSDDSEGIHAVSSSVVPQLNENELLK